MKIIIINGPNLNLLGQREPEIYGTLSFDDYFKTLQATFPTVHLTYYQSNHEGCLIDKLQDVGFSYDGIILNAGAYTHTSIALHDCIKAITSPVIEVHITAIDQRESFRQHSYLTPVVSHCIMGKGLPGYRLAIEKVIGSDR